MPRKITIAEARGIARQIQTDADARRAAFAEDEARRTTDVVGHCAVATGSRSVSSAYKLLDRWFNRAVNLTTKATPTSRARVQEIMFCARDLRRQMDLWNKRQPTANEAAIRSQTS